MNALYLVKEDDRTVILAVESEGRLYGYVPNVAAFVYNKPLSTDFLIDRNLTYTPVTADEAAEIIKAGKIGKIDGRTNKFLLDHTKAETRRIDPTEVLDASKLHEPEPTPTTLARAKADIVRKAQAGQWITYKAYPSPSNLQAARQLASDLRTGRVRAFRDLAVQTRILAATNGGPVVQIARTAAAALKKPRAVRQTRSIGRTAAAAAAAKKPRVVRQTKTPRTKGDTR